MPYREWTTEEIERLIAAAKKYKKGRGVDWKAVSEFVGTRTER